MLDRARNETLLRSAPTEGDVQPTIDLGETVRAAFAGLLRNWFLVVGVTVAFICLGMLHILNATPLYRAGASIVIDPRIESSMRSQTTAAPALFLADALVVDSEVKVLQSRELAYRLIDRLNLPPDFGRGEPSLFGQVSGFIRDTFDDLMGGEAPKPPVLEGAARDQQRRERIRRALVQPLGIERSGETFVIDISYVSEDPVFAARVVNALVEEYFLAQAESAFDNTRRVNEWLSTRVTVLADAVAEADAAVEQYRTENDLFSVQGELLPANVELAAANDELIRTRNEIVDLNAQIAQSRSVIESGSINTNLDEAVQSTALSTFQNQYVEILDRERELAARLGEGHALVAQAREDLERTRQLIYEELQKIIERLEGRRDRLQLQADNTAERIEELRSVTAGDAQLSIKLRELEREAESKRRLYETMLGELDETTQQQTFAPSAARIIARAVPPDRKASPNSKLILALSAFAGLVIGSGLAFLREALDDVFRRASEIEDELGVPLIGIAPLIGDDRRMVRRKARGAPIGRWEALRKGLTRQGIKFRFAADNDGSMFAEALRALAVSLAPTAADRDRCTVVGVTSVRKGEGKSTLAGNFATMQAARGYRVALLDLDLRNPVLAEAVKFLPAQNSVGHLLDNPDSLDNIVPSDGLSDVYLISNEGNGSIVLSDLATLSAMEDLVGRLRERFDYVVVDLAPIVGLVDARVGAGLVDKMVLAIEWGRIRKGRVHRALMANGAIRSRLVGVIYTKVRVNAYAAYNGSVSKDYYRY